MNKNYVEIGDSLSFSDITKVAYREKKLKLSENARDRIKKGHETLQEMLQENKEIYGVNTGVGALQDTKRSMDHHKQGKRILRSHAACVGEPIEDHIVRGTMVLLANNLASGHSGVRIKVVNLLIQLLNNHITPYVPKKGSVGSSGDLSPLAHIGLTLIGEGEVLHNQQKKKSRKTLKREDVTPFTPSPREALALINGTHLMTARSVFNISKALNLLQTAEIITSLAFEAFQAHKSPLNHKIYELRPHPGQLTTVKNMRTLLKDSELIGSDKEDLQDAYSLRCAPQVLGSAREGFLFSKKIITREVNSITDNPIIVWKDKQQAISGGNFHGAPICLSQETLGTAIATIGNIAERRIARLLDSKLSGFSSFLTPNPGDNSGFMIPQYTAAALVAENKTLAHPVNVDSIPTSANQEDFNNFGTIAARKTKQIIDNVRKIIGIEALCTVQAIDLMNAKDQLGEGTGKAYSIIRETVPFLEEDSIPMYKLINKIENLVATGSLAKILKHLNPTSER